MEKSNKIFLTIIIVLIIALGITIVLYINANKLAKDYLQKLLYSNTQLTNYVKATEDFGLESKEQDDHSYKLIERSTSIEKMKNNILKYKTYMKEKITKL